MENFEKKIEKLLLDTFKSKISKITHIKDLEKGQGWAGAMKLPKTPATSRLLLRHFLIAEFKNLKCAT